MPELSFVLPHWIYWSTLAVFPAIALWCIKLQGQRIYELRRSPFLAYLFWLTGGFLGLHRFYFRSWAGLLFVAIFLGAMYGESHVVAERENVSRTNAVVRKATPALERLQKLQARNPANVAPEKLEQAQAALKDAQAALAVAQGDLEHWRRMTRWIAILLGLALLLDAFLLPGLLRRWNQRVAQAPPAAGKTDAEISMVDAEEILGVDPRYGVFAPYTRWIDRINEFIGEYVAYWILISVFIYFYEVVARYALNSPTNWAHESMFLMFGMQYALIGAYAYRDDSHVRVDIFYSRLSVRGKALADVLTSFFFFVFTITLLITSWRFAMDGYHNGEVSFTEWQIQYWPVKFMLPLGSLLILLQGVVRLARDLGIVLGKIQVNNAATQEG